MALTPIRWLVAAAAGCAIALALVLSYKPSPRTWRGTARDSLVERHSRLDRAATSAARQLRTSQLVDSVERSLARMPSSTVSRVVVGSGFRRGAEFSDGLTRRLRADQAATGAAPIDVVLLVDTATVLRGKSMAPFARVTHVLPATRDQRCLAILRFDRSADRSGRFALDNEHVGSEILGPCGFYAAFGAPGAGIEPWLRADGWAFGVHAQGYSQPFAFSIYDWYNTGVPWAASAGFPLRNHVGGSGFGCVTGDRDACLRTVLSPRMTPRRLGMERVTSDGLISRALLADAYYSNNEFGIPSHSLLSDMATSLGNDKFRAFWKSDRPPAEAFAAATGEDLGAWLARWASGRYGEAHRGPGSSAGGVLVSLLVAVGAVGAATVGARRRQAA